MVLWSWLFIYNVVSITIGYAIWMGIRWTNKIEEASKWIQIDYTNDFEIDANRYSPWTSSHRLRFFFQPISLISSE